MAEQRRARTKKTTDCGPSEVKVTAKGSWQENKTTACESARDQARAVAAATCRGNCASTQQSCKYLEQKISFGAEEERQDPRNPNVTQYRYECASEGTCQCE
jgi:hypothetical protein